jgi:hypothetical protein
MKTAGMLLMLIGLSGFVFAGAVLVIRGRRKRQ